MGCGWWYWNKLKYERRGISELICGRSIVVMVWIALIYLCESASFADPLIWHISVMYCDMNSRWQTSLNEWRSSLILNVHTSCLWLVYMVPSSMCWKCLTARYVTIYSWLKVLCFISMHLNCLEKKDNGYYMLSMSCCSTPLTPPESDVSTSTHSGASDLGYSNMVALDNAFSG